MPIKKGFLDVKGKVHCRLQFPLNFFLNDGFGKKILYDAGQTFQRKNKCIANFKSLEVKGKPRYSKRFLHE